MNIIKIIDGANEQTIDKFNISSKIIYSFVVVDVLMLIMGFVGLYEENVSGFIDPKLAIMLCIIFIIFSSILMCMGLTRSIMKPLNEFINAADKIAEGDLTVEVNVSSKDELGKLAEYFKRMTLNLRTLTGKVQNVSSKVAITAQELSGSSEEMKTSTDQISNTTQHIASGISSQASKISEVSRAMKEISQSVQQVATSSQKAAQGATDASTTASQVGKMSDDVTLKMAEIQSTVDNSATVIRQLDGKSQQIGEIIGVITNIADQTNLLALNAAIEAARAGEHGRGFAVVADEVRKLAEESRSAANQITGLIKEIQQGTNQAVVAMENGTKTVFEGTKIMENTVSAINQIVKAAADVAAMINEIAAATEQQSASVEEVTSSVEDVSSICEESAAGTQETSAAAEEQTISMDVLVNAARELAKLSDELQDEVAKFNIGEFVTSQINASTKTAKNKPERSQKKMKEQSTSTSGTTSTKDKKADVGSSYAGSSLEDLTK
ncbi:Methyl-accepting chemotaxis protein McpA [Methanosarcinales archaeon]|nr:HAMP domain-containing methyl-accepting chemotaxis protein [Candidatus Methanoperedens sp. BLZ2]KAB2946058.1 MAG: methyl-accepting chemotaxis protein [Candidatus Methanoperedens sp.]MBZ0175000.1 methyl-accepting chemotaxis protein [Candidatus Methanoperedens nitroreducens]CAG0996998.1 Methyl-accepting chemotaxis protein McpA [Methanosarcinales archaeon]MCX9076619.1 HAMP domain-containing methyl-accepting chemotaxis protein [Candidatus Methanoperedens sp.]MCX9087640.1 HAMP domain-containing 